MKERQQKARWLFHLAILVWTWTHTWDNSFFFQVGDGVTRDVKEPVRTLRVSARNAKETVCGGLSSCHWRVPSFSRQTGNTIRSRRWWDNSRGFVSRFLTLTQTSEIPVMWANHTNHMLEYFLSSLVLNVYVWWVLRTAACVLTTPYLWATHSHEFTRQKPCHSNNVPDLCSLIVLLFMLFLHFKPPSGPT